MIGEIAARLTSSIAWPKMTAREGLRKKERSRWCRRSRRGAGRARRFCWWEDRDYANGPSAAGARKERNRDSQAALQGRLPGGLDKKPGVERPKAQRTSNLRKGKDFREEVGAVSRIVTSCPRILSSAGDGRLKKRYRRTVANQLRLLPKVRSPRPGCRPSRKVTSNNPVHRFQMLQWTARHGPLRSVCR